MLSASAYSFRQKSRLAISLSWVAGYTNVITFILCGVVVAHATGNVTHLGQYLAERDLTRAWRIGGFLVLAFCGVQVALAARDRFGSLLAGGIVGWLVVQTFINVGGVTGLMPVTGLTLPYFSAGGSSLFVCMAASGLLLNVARHAR